MKVTTIIRLLMAAVFYTVSCIGIATGKTLLIGLWSISWLLMLKGSEITKPIEYKRIWVGIMIILIVIVIGMVVTLNVMHLTEPNATVRFMLAAVFWFIWMYIIYHRWQKEKGKAAHLMMSNNTLQRTPSVQRSDFP